MLEQSLIDASFGEDYYLLKSRYPTWGTDLHREGHKMTNEKLTEIFHYGLLWWYIHNCGKVWNAKFLEMNPLCLSTYDIKCVFKSIGSVPKGQHAPETVGSPTDISEKIRKQRQFAPGKTVFECLCEYPEKDIVMTYIKTEASKIQVDPDTVFKKLMKEPILTKLGVFFQRSKIILERMKATNDNVSLIYSLDRLNLAAMEIIYNWVATVCDNREYQLNHKIVDYLDTLCLPVVNLESFTLPAELR
jgi:hypothetical protein